VPGSSSTSIITLYVDADACPVKQEIYHVAEYSSSATRPIAVPRDRRIERGVTGSS
jgi:uncharacterized protein YaiI (UPF0178 family)